MERLRSTVHGLACIRVGGNIRVGAHTLGGNGVRRVRDLRLTEEEQALDIPGCPLHHAWKGRKFGPLIGI